MSQKKKYKYTIFSGTLVFVFFLIFFGDVPCVFADGGGGPLDDGTPAREITTLSVIETGLNSVILQWTAVSGNSGGGGNSGTYQIPVALQGVYYSLSPFSAITEPGVSNYNSAEHPSIIPAPVKPNEIQIATIPNLTPGTTYYFRMGTRDAYQTVPTIGNQVSATTNTEEISGGDGEGGGEGTSGTQTGSSGFGGVQPRQAIFSGKTFVGGTVEFLVKDVEGSNNIFVPDTSVFVDTAGSFKVSAKPFLAREYFFALKAKDKDGKETGTIGFPVNFETSQKIEKADIFFPPTLGFITSAVPLGGSVILVGYALPEAIVTIELDGNIINTTSSDGSGKYSYTINTDSISSGNHSIRVRQALSSGVVTNFSQTNTFRVSNVSVPEADFNGDNTINIIDWSIFLTAWGSDDPKLQIRADLDKDNKVTISDFAIFLEALIVE